MKLKEEEEAGWPMMMMRMNEFDDGWGINCEGGWMGMSDHFW
jgi:hypothetical protein